MVSKKAAIFDVTQSPPDANELARLRLQSKLELQDIAARGKRLLTLYMALGVAGFIAVAGLWATGLLPGSSGRVVSVLFTVIGFVAAITASFAAAEIVDIYSLVSRGVQNLCLGAVAFAIIVATIIVAFVHTRTAVAIAESAAIVVVVTIAATIARNKYIDDRIAMPTHRCCNELLTDLEDMDASSRANEYIQFLKWCRQDETLKAYQHALAEMGRKPVVGEYRAAKDWVQSAGHKDKESRTREACEQLARPV